MTFEQLRSRRDFLRLGCRTLSSIGAAAAFGQAGLITARAQSSGNYKAMVCIFLFGGHDANNLLVPNDAATYPNYQKIRQNLALSQRFAGDHSRSGHQRRLWFAPQLRAHRSAVQLQQAPGAAGQRGHAGASRCREVPVAGRSSTPCRCR